MNKDRWNKNIKNKWHRNFPSVYRQKRHHRGGGWEVEGLIKQGFGHLTSKIPEEKHSIKRSKGRKARALAAQAREKVREKFIDQALDRLNDGLLYELEHCDFGRLARGLQTHFHNMLQELENTWLEMKHTINRLDEDITRLEGRLVRVLEAAKEEALP